METLARPIRGQEHQSKVVQMHDFEWRIVQEKVFPREGFPTYVLQEIHEGVCGNHLGLQSLVGKIVRVEYFWLTT